jgi:hypothetical protein
MEQEEASRKEAAQLKAKQEEASRKEAAQLKAKLAERLNLAKASEKINPKTALTYYQEVVDLAPDSPEAKGVIGKIEDLKRRVEAQLNATLNQKMGLAKGVEKTNPKAAIRYYEEVIDLAPDSSQAKAATERIGMLRKRQ